jgi:predicted outer membrane repeat protein
MNHKKLLLTLTLCLCALLCMVVTASASEVQNTGSHSHELCKKTVCTNPEHIKSGTHGNVTFATELRQDGNTLYIGADKWEYDSVLEAYILPAGTYYLGTNLTLNHRIQIQNSGGEVTLCLNGNTVMCTGNGAVIQTPTGAYSANFTLCDCQPNGSVGKITHKTGATGSGVDLQRAANTPAHTFIMYNGYITGNTSTSGGGGVSVADSTTFTMYGGSIVDNKANPGRYASNGGGVYVAGGDTENKYFTMYGGSITGNHTAGDGGGIYSTSNNISIYGGSVTGNSAERNGGAVYVAGTMIVGGDINISGNWKGDAQSSASNDNANNVYLSEYGNNGSSDGPATIAIEEPLTGTGNIGITTKTSVATTRNASVKIAAGKGTYAITDEDKGHFTPDTGYCEVQKKNDGIYLTHVHSGGTATCTAKAKCGGCNAPYGDALGHDFVHHDAQPATCTAKGLEAYDTCSRCDYSTTKVEIPMADHTYSATEWKSDVDNHWHECSVCHTQIGKAAHEWQPATYTAPKTCVCGATQGEPLTRSYYYYAPSAAENKKDSPKAGDPGVLLYAGLALASLTGLACTAKKRH